MFDTLPIRRLFFPLALLVSGPTFGQEQTASPSSTPEVTETAPVLAEAPVEAAPPFVPRAVHVQVSGDLGVVFLGGELPATYLISPIGLITGLSLGASFFGDRLETGAYYQYGITTDFFTHLAMVNAFGGYVGVRPFARILHISVRAGAHLSEGLGGFIIPLFYRGGAWGWSAGPRIALEFPIVERENFGFYLGPEFGLTYFSRTTALPSFFMISATLGLRFRF